MWWQWLYRDGAAQRQCARPMFAVVVCHFSLCPSGPHALRVAAKRSPCRYTAIDVRDSPTHAFVASYRRHLQSTAAAAAAAEGSLFLNPQSTGFLARSAGQ